MDKVIIIDQLLGGVWAGHWSGTLFAPLNLQQTIMGAGCSAGPAESLKSNKYQDFGSEYLLSLFGVETHILWYPITLYLISF